LADLLRFYLIDSREAYLGHSKALADPLADLLANAVHGADHFQASHIVLVEHSTLNRLVAGSIPTASTILFSHKIKTSQAVWRGQQR